MPVLTEGSVNEFISPAFRDLHRVGAPPESPMGEKKKTPNDLEKARDSINRRWLESRDRARLHECTPCQGVA